MVKWEDMGENSGKLEGHALEFNINENVVVSLTEDWEERLKNYYMDLYRNRDYKNEGYGSLEEYVEKKVIPTCYKDGYYKDQLWMIMKIFWEGWQDPFASPFEGCKIYFRGWIGGVEKVSDEVSQNILRILD